MDADTEIAFTCRGCMTLETKAVLHSLENDTVRELFTRCTEVPVYLEESHLPMQICSLCFGRCENWDSFRMRCKENDERLREKYAPLEWESEIDFVADGMKKEDFSDVPQQIDIMIRSNEGDQEEEVEILQEDVEEEEPMTCDESKVELNPSAVQKSTVFLVCICEECGAELKSMLAYRKHKFHHEKNLPTPVRKLQSVKAKVEQVNPEEEILVNSWTQKERKKRRESGQAYLTNRADVVRKRKLRPISCTCAHKCGQNFSDMERELLFQEYWAMDYGEKRRYVHEVVVEKQCKRVLTANSRRAYTLEYHLNNKRVCKKFFCATLDISDRIIMHCKLKARQNLDVASDFRGHKTKERMMAARRSRGEGDSSS